MGERRQSRGPYNINLAHVTGSSGGANASGVVILSVKAPSDELCWSLSRKELHDLHQYDGGDDRHHPAHLGNPSTPGNPLGFAYKSAGYVHEPSIFLGRLQAQPGMFYVSIYNSRVR